MLSAYNFSFIIASINNAFLRPAVCVYRLSFAVDFSTGVCYGDIMENDTEQKSSRRPAVIFAVLALWVILKWMFEFGMVHRLSWVELGVFVPLIFIDFSRISEDGSGFQRCLSASSVADICFFVGN